LKQLNHPATIIAALALFLAIGGGAYAGAARLASQQSTLPHGTTLRGVFLDEGEGSSENSNVGDSISFGWTLKAAPKAHFIKVGDKVPAGCSGTVKRPGAKPGNLCVFEKENSNINDAQSEVWSPAREQSHVADAYGAGVFSETAGAGTYEFGGTWAVTAP
jgi:hypothetical protein